ncbi:unnamed protein product [Trichobilharzia regenti]|nr:unnamed protein product [Trichobilharzia regenti]
MMSPERGETHTGLLHRWRSRNRQQLQLKKVGVSTFDDIFKATASTLRQACELRTSVLTNFDNFRRLCGETSTPLSMNQCIRALSTRVGASFGSPDLWPVRMRIRPEDEMPHLELQNSFMGSGLSVYPSLHTLGDPSQLPLPSSASSSITGGSITTRNSSLRFSPAPGLHRSPSLILSPRLFLNRRLKSSSKSIDEDATSTLSIDVIGCHSQHNHTHATTHDHSPTVSTMNMNRRQSIHSSSSSISSFSVGRMDKLKKTLIESCKTLIKQGPYLRVKLQQTQRTALEAYTTFLEGLKAPSSTHATAISRLTSSASSRSSSSRITTSDTGLGSLTSEFSRRLISGNSDDRNKKLTTSTTTTTIASTTITPGASIYWRRMSRVADNVTWNLRLLTGQVELLTLLLNESNDWIKQAKESSTATGLLIKPDTSSSSISDTNSSPTYSSNHKEDEYSSGISLECPLVNKPALPTVLQHSKSNSNSNTRRSPIPNDTVEASSNLTKNLLSPLPESPCSNQLFNTYEESELATRLTMMTTSVTPPSMPSSSSTSTSPVPVTTTPPSSQLTSKRSPSKVSSLYNSSSSIKLIPTINETRSTLHDKISLSPSILNTGSNNNNSTGNTNITTISNNNSNNYSNSTIMNTNSSMNMSPMPPSSSSVAIRPTTTTKASIPTSSSISTGNLSRIKNRFNQAWKK